MAMHDWNGRYEFPIWYLVIVADKLAGCFGYWVLEFHLIIFLYTLLLMQIWLSMEPLTGHRTKALHRRPASPFPTPYPTFLCRNGWL